MSEAYRAAGVDLVRDESALLAIRRRVESFGKAMNPGLEKQADIPAGSFVMGDQYGDGRVADGEVPVHPVELDAFSIDVHTVTNDDFAAFVDATGYQTESEVFRFSAVFHLAFDGDDADVLGRAEHLVHRLAARPAERPDRRPDPAAVRLVDHPGVPQQTGHRR